ncbi:MAG: iron ABC transporter permease, partial [Staphylococcus simulans]|nr:iron ABC transporter permease [Staphylococcus simulans]
MSDKERKEKYPRFILLLLLSCVMLGTMLVLSILYGDAPIRLGAIYEAVFHYNPMNEQHNIISEIRIPRDLGAILVGMALAVAGAVVQGVTKNGLADPSLIGLNAGASFMLALTYAFVPQASFSLLMLAGFIGSILGGTIVLMMG